MPHKTPRYLDPDRTAEWVKILSEQSSSGEFGCAVSLATNTIYDLSEDFKSEKEFVDAITRRAVKRRGCRIESFAVGTDDDENGAPVLRWRHIRGLGKKKFAELIEVLEHKGYEIWPHLEKAKEGPPREISEESIEEKLDRIEERLIRMEKKSYAA